VRASLTALFVATATVLACASSPTTPSQAPPAAGLGAVEAQQWLNEEREETRAALEAWEAGKYPDDESGKKIAALIKRSDAQTGARMREYCQLLTWILLKAEDTLHDQVDDTEKLHVEGRQAFIRLDKLRSELGRANVATLKALLPFSRNDYWEISELEERLGR